MKEPEAVEGLPARWIDGRAVSHAVPDERRHGTPIVFVHGAWGGKYQFVKWMRLAAREGWASYALDLRGHGETPCENPGRASVEAYADDLEAIIRNIGPCHVVGHSLGGLVLQLVASRCRLVQKAVLVASAPPAGTFARYTFKRRALSPFYLRRIITMGPLPIMRKDALRYLFDGSPVAQEFDFGVPESSRAILDIGLWRVRVTSLLCPSLVVAAANDRAIPVRTQLAIARKYGSDYLQVPDIGHMMMLEDGWGETLRTILGWLR